jgi:very-short-patch-repair endonuclease
VTRLSNVQKLKAFRRELRSALTLAEVRLWGVLKNSQLAGRKFRRQHSVGPYILDFYCPAEQLAIELDGSAHDSEVAEIRDGARDAYLNKLGIRVVHYENRHVMTNLEGVLQDILRRLGA